MASTPPVALVTGGARRIGRAIVEDLAAHGWAIAIHYNRSREDAETVAGAIRAAGGRAALVTGDFADFGCLKGIVDQAADALGAPTLLVNNASIFENDTVGALDRHLWERQLTINLAAPVFLAEAFAARVPDGVEGNVVNLLDQRIWKPTPRHFSYQISKSALFTATETLAQALAPRIRVNAIAPGPVLPSARMTRGTLPQADGGHPSSPAACPCRLRPHRPLFRRDPLDHRPGHRPRRRPAPRLADPRHRRHPGVTGFVRDAATLAIYSP